MDVAVGGWRETTSDVVGEVGNEMLESKAQFICFVKPDGEFTKTVLVILGEGVPLYKFENLTAKGLPLQSLLVQLPAFMKPSCLELQ